MRKWMMFFLNIEMNESKKGEVSYWQKVRKETLRVNNIPRSGSSTIFFLLNIKRRELKKT